MEQAFESEGRQLSTSDEAELINFDKELARIEKGLAEDEKTLVPIRGEKGRISSSTKKKLRAYASYLKWVAGVCNWLAGKWYIPRWLKSRLRGIGRVATTIAKYLLWIVNNC